MNNCFSMKPCLCLLGLSVLAGWSISSVAASAQPPAKPNILWIVLDDDGRWHGDTAPPVLGTLTSPFPPASVAKLYEHHQ
jgi:hypothetical protein